MSNNEIKNHVINYLTAAATNDEAAAQLVKKQVFATAGDGANNIVAQAAWEMIVTIAGQLAN